MYSPGLAIASLPRNLHNSTCRTCRSMPSPGRKYSPNPGILGPRASSLAPLGSPLGSTLGSPLGSSLAALGSSLDGRVSSRSILSAGLRRGSRSRSSPRRVAISLDGFPVAFGRAIPTSTKRAKLGRWSQRWRIDEKRSSFKLEEGWLVPKIRLSKGWQSKWARKTGYSLVPRSESGRGRPRSGGDHSGL